MVDNHVITKSNNLIEARYRLTLEEQRLLLYLVSKIQPKDEDFKVYTISVKDFLSLINVKNQSIYSHFKVISAHLMSKPLVLKKESSLLVMNWLSSAEYYRGQGKIELSFDPKLKPYLLKLKDNFTSYKLKNVIMLKSFYSIRLYELLKQYERLNERTFALVELREYLGIDDGLYPMYSNFKQKVLSVAHRELKEKSDLFFEFDEIKIGRKIEKIKFMIYKKAGVPEGLKSSERPDLPLPTDKESDLEKLKKIMPLSLTDQELLAIYEAAGGDLSLIARRYAEAKTKPQLENMVGFMIWACKLPEESFKKKPHRGQTRYHNFKAREKDYCTLEKMERALLAQEIIKEEEVVKDEGTVLL